MAFDDGGDPIPHQSARPGALVEPTDDDAEKDTVYLYHGQDDDRPLLWRTTLNDLTGAMGDLLSKRRKQLGKSLLLAESVVDESPTNGDEQVDSVAALKARRAGKRGGGVDGPGDEVPGEEPEGGESAERKEARLLARADYLAKERELQGVKGDIATDDVLMRLRKQQAGELASSVLECEEGSEQAHTWIKALEDVSSKRKSKLEDNDTRHAQAKAGAAEAEQALEQLEAELMAGKVAHNVDQATLRNTALVEGKTSDVWTELNDSMRASHKEVMTEAAERQRAQLRLSKHLQDLTIGEQEVAKRLAIQVRAEEEIGVEGIKLKKLWRRSYLEEDMLVAGASAEVEAEERARAHLIGHGDRIRAKFEQASGNLTAQKAVVAEQSEMDAALKGRSEAAQQRIWTLQRGIDNEEDKKGVIEQQKDEVQEACQDKVEYLNSSLRAIETSANAVATEQVIAQRTLAVSEESLETMEDGESRFRLEEDIEALRTSLVSIEARLHEVQKERAGVREARGKTQREAMLQVASLNEEADAIDETVQELLAERVALEADQRQLDGQRVVIHARVKQSRKALTPLEQERKLYTAELDWVREFEEHSFMRIKAKSESKLELVESLARLKDEGGGQLQEQAEDEAITRDCIAALAELREKVDLHRAHVDVQLRQAVEVTEQREADGGSLAATVQALEGKAEEADEAAVEAEEKRLSEQGVWDVRENELKGKIKEWRTRLVKEERAATAMGDGRSVLQEEVDEVMGQLSEQRRAAANCASLAVTYHQ
ncbi:hypothetical protein T484DRAFT_1743619 [Baffinella frigidus]|nr:hypothetical protein T484DRAFT_1743619 [Cryptophyta sp. CCMP2293]